MIPAVAYLEAEEKERDASGVYRTIRAERQIIVTVKSASQSEWFEGGRNGLNPSLVFQTRLANYNGEENIKYGNKIYHIYRTYISDPFTIELYTEFRKGTA